jgi:hypothetical protein
MIRGLRAANASCYAFWVMPRRVVPSFLVIVAFGVASGVTLLGCGRSATREDCEAVVDKNVELQLKALGVTDPAIVAKRREEMRASMKDDIDKCVGKRVTDSMMACVKSAETAEKIDKCLR